MAEKTGRKKLNITLNQWYPFARYGGVVASALIWPQLQQTTWLFPDHMGDSRWLLLWVVALLGINILLDRTYLRTMRRDLDELKRKVKGGGYNTNALKALASPLMLILDAVVIAHLYASFLKAGGVNADVETAGYHTAAMAAGVVLWIYGRALPKIRFRNIWGIKTRASCASVEAWGQIHLKAVPIVCAAGALAMVGAAFLPPFYGLVCAIICCAGAFVGMFTRKP